MRVLTVVSALDRRDLTGVCLDAIQECRRAGGETWVIDDGSREYDHDWLMSLGVTRVIEGPKRGVGAAARERFVVAAKAGSDFDLAILLDNDALVAAGFDVATLEAWAAASIECESGSMLLVTAYHSPFHHPIESRAGYDVLPHAGGINLACTGVVAARVLASVPDQAWDKAWDWQLGQCRIVRSKRGWIQHMGRHGGGVNGASLDRATDFVAWR